MSHAQHNAVTKKQHITKCYRRQFLEDLRECVRQAIAENNVNDVVLMGDINKHIEDKVITQFMNQNSLVNAHKQVNNIQSRELDHVIKSESNALTLCSVRMD